MPVPILVDLAEWPGIVLGISPAGIVQTSNGRLEALVGGGVAGHPFADVLDTESSRQKWERLSTTLLANHAVRCELILRGRTTPLEPRAFSVARAGTGGDATLWLVEHPSDPRLAQLSGHVEEMNAELATVQRALFKEQSRLERALKELERSNAALDEFAYAASHDLKAPLRAIADYAELLATEAAARLDEEQRGYVDRLALLSTKMRGMIDAVLEYARAGRSSSVPESIDSRAVLNDVIDFLEPPSDVTIGLSAELPVCEVRRVPFEQVFRNLLSNAIKHRGSAPAHVHVGVADDDACWHFVVADDGPGIAAAQQERIWRLFHTTRPGEGTGIGLALVKRLVEAEGGRVELESAPGLGARFHVFWPKRAGATTTVRAAAVRGVA